MDINELKDLLLQVPVFSAIQIQDLHNLLQVLPRKNLAAGEVLYRYSEQGDSLSVVLSGELVVELEQGAEGPVLIRTLRAGDMVGELACIDPAPRSATVRAKTTAQVLEMDRVLLTSIQRSSPKVAAAVVGGVTGLVCSRIRDTNETVVRSVRELLEGKRKVRASHAAENSQIQLKAPKLSHMTSQELPPHYPLESEDLRLLASVGAQQRMKDGEILCAEGARGDTAYFLIEGSLDVLREVGGVLRLLATIPKGGVVGQLALLDSRVRSATLRARGDVRVLALQRDTFLRLIENVNPFALRFQEHVCVTGIRQLRCATRLHGQIERILESREKGMDAVRESLQLNYVSAALEEWGLSLNDLDEMVVKTPDGMLTPAEVKARQNS